NEMRVVCDACEPTARGLRLWRIVKAAVDFGGVEVLGDERERVEFRAGAFGIDASAPVGIRPARRADQDVAMRAHETRLSPSRISLSKPTRSKCQLICH